MASQSTQVTPAPTSGASVAGPAVAAWGRADLVWLALLLLLAFAFWLPRLQGPIDLRYDGGVYYLLGTSIAQGKGYRILNEPGEPVGVQYPPALPALVAVHQWVLGTDDPIKVGTALRYTFCGLSILYILGMYIMARGWVGPGLAGLAGVICTLSFGTYYYADLLFTDVPCALVGVLIIIAQRWRSPIGRGVSSTLLAWLAFFLRTAGIALLAAWVGEALLRRQWKDAAIRAGLAAVPFVLWQGHVALTERSDAYQHPAYEYQRADYLFYNVSYANNARLIDPFQPELGRADNARLIRRVGENLLAMPIGVGEAASVRADLWQLALYLPFGKLGLPEPPLELTYLPLGLTSVLVFVGLGVLIYQRAWLIVLYAGFSIALICLTPWPQQFFRYLTPIVPLLILALVLGLRCCWLHAGRQAGWLGRGGRWLLVATAVSVLLAQLGCAYYMFRSGLTQTTQTYRGVETRTTRFFHGDTWRSMDRVSQWFFEHGSSQDLVATMSPHELYLKSGVKTIMPPFIIDPAEFDRLIAQAGVTYLVVDRFDFVDVGQRYAEPAVQAYPDRWELVYTPPKGELWVYRRVNRPAGPSE